MSDVAPGMMDRIDAEAALWHARLADDGSPRLRARFDAWMAAPAHASAYDRVTRGLAQIQDHARAPEILGLRQETLARTMVNRRKRRSVLPLAAAAVAILAVGSVWIVSDRDGPAADPVQLAATGGRTYETSRGERSTIKLSDGSTVSLNTSSQVREAFSAIERRLFLTGGQAYFDVAKGQSRPFVVVADGRTITAHGTAFDVRLRPQGLEVALFEGAVSVAGGKYGGVRETKMVPNEILTITGDALSVRRDAALARRAAWREGVMVFNGDSLADAVAEMNRYVDQPVTIGDPALGAMKVSGTFRTGDTDAFVEAMEIAFPAIHAEHGAKGTVLRRKPAP